MQQISLPQLSPLDYFKTFDLPALAPDRIFGFADAKLVNQVKLAAQQGEFDTQPAIDLTLHPGAQPAVSSRISSAKQMCRSPFMKGNGKPSAAWIVFT